jgi:hypothetical protein
MGEPMDKWAERIRLLEPYDVLRKTGNPHV